MRFACGKYNVSFYYGSPGGGVSMEPRSRANRFFKDDPMSLCAVNACFCRKRRYILCLKDSAHNGGMSFHQQLQFPKERGVLFRRKDTEAQIAFIKECEGGGVTDQHFFPDQVFKKPCRADVFCQKL